jgi:hypothetical protein
MKKPWVIGLLSIVPGLGFLVLGELGKGIGALVLTLLPLSCLFVPSETIAAIGLGVSVIPWTLQGIYAVIHAERQAQVENGTALPERPVSIAPLPPGASSFEKSLHKARKIVMPLLERGENLIFAMPAASLARADGSLSREILLTLLTGGPSSEVTGVLYLGITEQDLVLVMLEGTASKPSELQRIPRSLISSVQHRQSLLDDNLTIFMEEGEPLRLRALRHVRPATQRLVSLLSNHGRVGYHVEGSLQQDLRYDAATSFPTPSETRVQAFLSKHPILGPALLGAIGGITGVIASPILVGVLAVILEDGLSGSAQTGSILEGLSILMGGYCVIMFPFGGAFLGAIPGIVIGMIRNWQARRPSSLSPLLAGFLIVCILSIAATVAIWMGFNEYP